MNKKTIILYTLLTIIILFGIIFFTLNSAASRESRLEYQQASVFDAISKKSESSLETDYSVPTSVVSTIPVITNYEVVQNQPVAEPNFFQSLFRDRSASAPVITKPETIQGQLVVEYHDDFENPENSKIYTYVRTNTKDYVVSESLLKELSDISPGDTVLLELHDDASIKSLQKIASSTLKTNQPLPISPNHRLLVLLVDYPGASSQHPFTANEAHDMIFNGAINDFYKEQSYGRVEFTGDVYGWYASSDTELVGESGYCQSNLNNDGTPSDIGEVITQNNINLNNYDHILVVANCLQVSGTSGWSTLGAMPPTLLNGTVYNNISFAVVRYQDGFQYEGQSNYQIYQDINKEILSYFEDVIIHELGHSLGAPHAKRYSCGNNIVYAPYNCSHITYGNHYDNMGSNQYSYHFNALLKDRLGWFSPSEILNITQSGTYTISNLENQSSIPKAAVVRDPITNEPLYYLENRLGVGFDKPLIHPDLEDNKLGLFVNKVTGYALQGYRPSLIDMSPTGNSSDSKNVALDLNQEFTDEYGITIKPETFSPLPKSSMITFNVDYGIPECIINGPSVSMLSDNDIEISQGAGNILFNFEIDVANMNYPLCGDSEYTVSFELPYQWPLYSSGPIIINDISPGEVNLLDYSVVTPTNLVEGEYPFIVIVEDNVFGTTSQHTLMINVEVN